MKTDEFGIINGMHDIEYIKNVFDKTDTADFFTSLKQELPWCLVSWSEGIEYHRYVFSYGDIERAYNKYKILEELILIVKETYETDVEEVWCDYYTSGTDFLSYNQRYFNKNSLTFAFGEQRKLYMKNKESKDIKSFIMKSGDIFYTSNKSNRDSEFAIPKDKNKGETIFITFVIDTPYKKRDQHIRYLNVLGVGNIPIFFRGRTSEFPDNEVAVILPNSLLQMLEGIQNNNVVDDSSPSIDLTVEHTV